ncbi:hypothetical protein IAR50_003914 [Cryptococcus sp. DSM 104548]
MSADVVEKLGKAQLDNEPEGESNGESEAESGHVTTGGDGKGDGLQKKRKKKKKKTKGKTTGVTKAVWLGSIPEEQPAPAPESPEETKKWEKELHTRAKQFALSPWYILDDRTRPVLDMFRTPSCRNVELRTPRLRLRQVEMGDTTGIRRIKMEPSVQKTQLYGSPSISDIKESFQNRYIRSRDEYVFAITAVDPSTIEVKPPGNVRITNRMTTADGYLGNIALSLSLKDPSSPSLLPKKGEIYKQPTFAQLHQAGLTGKMFYEIHPQLWGQGIMGEAFVEVLRFAMEEVGCAVVQSDPTTGNDASIRLCVKNNMNFAFESTDNAYNKPQLIHEITSLTWFSINRLDKPGGKDRWGGKEVCRWCLNFRLSPPTYKCGGCDWAKYCSRECQKADWVQVGGHQEECAGR